MKKYQWSYEQFGWTDLTAKNRAIFESIELDLIPLRRNLQFLAEAEMSNDQIEQMFRDAETLSKEKNLRTGFGKSVSLPREALGKVNGILSKFGKNLQDSTVVQAFDAKFEELKNKIKAKLSKSEKGEKFLTFIDQLGQSAKAHPVWQSAIIGLVVAASSLLLGPASVPVVGFLLKGAVELLKGEKLSTAIGKGIKTAAFGFLAGEIVSSIAGWVAGLHIVGNMVTPEVVKVTIDASQHVHGVASHFHLSDVAMTVADKARLTQLILDFGDPSKMGTAYQELLKFSQHLASPEYIAELAAKGAKAAANQATQQAFATSVKQIGSLISAAAAGVVFAAGEVKGRTATAETRRLPQPVMEGLWADLTLQFGAGKLMKIWKQAGRPTDSVDIAEMMGNLGMSDEDIRALMTKSGLSAEDVEATMRGLAGKEGDETIEAPFKSGIESLDAEALEILKKKGEVAFDEFWKTKLPELEKKAEPPKDAEPAAPAKPATQANNDKEEPSVARQAIQSQIPSGEKKTKPAAPAKPTAPAKPGANPLSPAAAALAKQKRRAAQGLRENLDLQLAIVKETLQDLREHRINRATAIKKLRPLMEFASGGATSAGGIASIPNAGGPMMPIIRRMPAGQSFFGPAGTAPQPKQKKHKKNTKKH